MKNVSEMKDLDTLYFGTNLIKNQMKSKKNYHSVAEPVYVQPLQTDLDLHCLPLSLWIYINNLDQVIWLAEN